MRAEESNLEFNMGTSKEEGGSRAFFKLCLGVVRHLRAAEMTEILEDQQRRLHARDWRSKSASPMLDLENFRYPKGSESVTARLKAADAIDQKSTMERCRARNAVAGP
jgi:hypothetical protein